MQPSKIDLSLLERSLKSFKEALNPCNLLERDGAIQRFEFTFEISWKTLAKVIQADKPLEDISVKGVLREAGRLNLIDDVEKWFEFQLARNRTSHTYDQKVAEEVFKVASQLPPYVEELLKRLKTQLAK
jgi:nucleotidyltransferase substrate binding protein (TIGR01987 family)